jgi:hypothetical protein
MMRLLRCYALYIYIYIYNARKSQSNILYFSMAECCVEIVKRVKSFTLVLLLLLLLSAQNLIHVLRTTKVLFGRSAFHAIHTSCASWFWSSWVLLRCIDIQKSFNKIYRWIYRMPATQLYVSCNGENLPRGGKKQSSTSPIQR